MMKEQYQKEVSQIHVPEELLEKTKKAMKEEEESLLQKRTAKIPVPFFRISLAAAAAVLLLIIVPVAVHFQTGDEQTGEEMQMQMHLSELQDPVMIKIEKGDGETEEKPAAFADAGGITIEENIVFIIKDTLVKVLEELKQR